MSSCFLKNGHLSFDLVSWFLQILSVQQLYRICTLYWDDNYNTRSVSPDVSTLWKNSCSPEVLRVCLLLGWIWPLSNLFVESAQVISSMRVLMTEDSNSAVSSSFLLDDNSRWKFILFSHNHSFLSNRQQLKLLRNLAYRNLTHSSFPLCFVLACFLFIIVVHLRHWQKYRRNRITKHWPVDAFDDSIPFSVDDLSNSLQEKDFSDVKAATELIENPAFQFLDEWGSGISSMVFSYSAVIGAVG